ncbi:unnamed protein product [Linum trigynum]|uniref:Uncharacterized protein n=1 Tax=Linum trigynum TaxID=586398 RepID=A0AAV2E6E9_9ROSI
MDIYPASFIDSSNDFATLTRESDFPCFNTFYENEVKKLDSRQWDVKLSKASEVKPEWGLIHHVIARSVGGKNRSKGGLTARNVTLFQSMHFPWSLLLGLSILSIFKCYETYLQRFMEECLLPNLPNIFTLTSESFNFEWIAKQSLCPLSF